MQPTTELQSMLTDSAGIARAQDRHEAALAAWQAEPGVAAVLDSFSDYAAGAALSALPALSALFAAERHAAAGLTGSLVRAFSAALVAAPLGQVPLHHTNERGFAALLLARRGTAALNLVAFDGGALGRAAPSPSVAFASGEEWDVVVAGRGSGRLIERRDNGLVSHPIKLSPGTALGRDGEREVLLVDRAGTAAGEALVLLRLQRRSPGLIPSREYELASGKLIHQSDPTPRESRHAVAVTLLGRMGRTDAAPLLAELAAESQRSEGLRWQALRECLGLDSAAGFRALEQVARDAADPLAHPAGALRAQLLEQYPALAEIA
jgi:hypothetical protein